MEIFHGPLDLLLYLIKRDELDIYDIPIARITDSYMQHVMMLKDLKDEAGFDINLAGEFLVMAATLMEIKSLRSARTGKWSSSRFPTFRRWDAAKVFACNDSRTVGFQTYRCSNSMRA